MGRVTEITVAGDRKFGRLVNTGPNRYEGSCAMPDGTVRRKTFNCRPAVAKESFYEWHEAELAKFEEKRAKRAARKERERLVAEEMEDDVAERRIKEAPEAVYVVQVVGGAAITWTETFDGAAAIADALTAAAKASGFAAKYDVTEVRRWSA